ncbi:hypothetical protein BDZ89DRAFT_1158955 [Hymenopellis radicata]|nr:hypothetical protein BDZ89DRAFT_1158955 [Hymenopellis radicata]
MEMPLIPNADVALLRTPEDLGNAMLSTNFRLAEYWLRCRRNMRLANNTSLFTSGIQVNYVISDSIGAGFESLCAQLLRLARRDGVFRLSVVLQLLARRSLPDHLFEARAILLGRLGRHHQALELYAYNLKVHLEAEDSRLDPVETLKLLPPLVTAQEVRAFLTESLHALRTFDGKVVHGVAKSRGGLAGAAHDGLQAKMVRVTDARICPQCHKRLGSSDIELFFLVGWEV